MRTAAFVLFLCSFVHAQECGDIIAKQQHDIEKLTRALAKVTLILQAQDAEIDDLILRWSETQDDIKDFQSLWYSDSASLFERMRVIEAWHGQEPPDLDQPQFY